MTPHQHKAEAERLLTLFTDSRRLRSVDDLDRITAHATLAKTAGSGTHYDAADAALTKAARARDEAHNYATFADGVAVGLAHALLAD